MTKTGHDAASEKTSGRIARKASTHTPATFDATRGLHDQIGNRSVSRLLRRKLAVDPPDSPLEYEADALAERMVGGSSVGGTIAHSSDTMHRHCAACASGSPCSACVDGDRDTVRRRSAPGPDPSALYVADDHARRLGPGRPLDHASRAYFEPRLGRDLQDVRVHDDAAAATSARDLRALAYTVGSDIVFAAGQHAPETSEGRKLLAHELVHVAQDSGAAAVQRQPDGYPAPTMEMQAYDYILKHGPGSDASEATRTTLRAMQKFGGSEPRSRWVQSINFVVPESGPFGGKVFSPLIEVGRTWVLQTEPDPSAGWNFNVYLSDVGGYPIHRTPAIHISGTTFRVFMGTPLCPGCHFGQGLQVDLYGGNWVMMTVVPSMTMAAGLANARGGGGGFETPGAPPPPPPGGWGIRGVAPSPTTSPTMSPSTAPSSTGGGHSGGAYMGGGAAPKLQTYAPPAVQPRATLSLVPDAPPVATPQFTPAPWANPTPMMTPMPFGQTQPFPEARPVPEQWKDFWPDESPEEERRRRRRAITLRLPRAKARHIDRYESMIATRSLVHDHGYSRPDPTDPRQAERWRAELDPHCPGGMNPSLYRIGVQLLRSRFGMDADRAHRTVLVPSWSRNIARIPMSVDHILELQLTFPHDRSWANSIMNWALLDLSTNSSVGSRLANNIYRERRDLVADTWDVKYWRDPLVFEAVVIDEYGSEGEHWTIHEIRRGEHVLVMLDWFGIPRPR